MITSFIEGRIRIKDAALKNPATMQTVLTLIQAEEGISSAVPNPKTGSILVRYDPEKISKEMLLEAAAMMEQHLPKTDKAKGQKASLLRKGSENCRQLISLTPTGESLLLGGLCLLTAVSGFFGKRTHMTIGLAFIALCSLHLYKRKNHLKIAG